MITDATATGAQPHDMAITPALKDQEKAGIDIVSDGELRRDNDIDYLLARIAGVQIQVPTNRSGRRDRSSHDMSRTERRARSLMP